MHPIALGLILGLVLTYHTTAQAETGKATPTGVCTTKTGSVECFGFNNGPATFTLANPCTGSTLHMMIQVPESSNACMVCSSLAALAFVQRGQQFLPRAWVYTDERWEPFTPLAGVQEKFCESSLLPGVTVYTLVAIDPQRGLDLRAAFSVFYDNQRVVDFP